ncbi:MAG: ATP-binding protein [Candidatus Solibacter sp.]
MSADRNQRHIVPKSFLEENVEELYEMAPCGYLSTDVEGYIVKVNATLADWLDYERQELTADKRFVDLLTVGGKIFYETHFSLLLRMRDAVDEIALDLVCKDGRVLPVLINARQKRDEAGEPVLNHFTIFNATERRMYERDILASRNLFQTTLSSIGDGVIATDAAGVVTFMNPVAEALSGWNTENAVGKPIEEVLVLRRENSTASVPNPIRKALLEGVIVGLENHTILLARDGRSLHIDDSGSPIRDAGGAIVGAVLAFRDITAQRKVESELKEAHRQLEISAAELKRSNEDLSQFAYVASHDLRSPLNTVVQFSQLLERQYGDQLGDGKQLLDYVTGAAKRMQNLIDDLLSYAKVSAEEAHVFEPVDANLRLQAALENLRGPIEATHAVVTHDALPALPVSGTSLVQLFQNLVGNAVHYRGDDPPRVHISVEKEDGWWRFSCKDNGIGIAPEHQLRIFDAFRRLHGVERPGSGIGLGVCKKIVEHYKGRIWVESAIDRGSTFFFTLPANNS